MPESGQPVPAFEAEVESVDGAERVAARGEIDIATAPTLENAIAEAVGRSEKPLVVDLSEVSFLESMGLRVLLQARSRLEERNRVLAVVCAPESPIQRLFDLTRTNDALLVSASLEDALARASESPRG